jgi:hypothetical protein
LLVLVAVPVLVLVAVVMAVIVLAAHGSGLLLGSQIQGDHFFHALLGAAVGPQPLGCPDPIKLHPKGFRNPAGEKHLALATGAAAFGNHDAILQTSSNVYK